MGSEHRGEKRSTLLSLILLRALPLKVFTNVWLAALPSFSSKTSQHPTKERHMPDAKNFFEETIQKHKSYRTASRISDLQLLEPNTRAAVESLIADALKDGVDLMVWETFRSKERQKRLFDEGRTKLKNVGVHHYGLACDLVRNKKGQPSWDGDFSVIGRLAPKYGLVWGGNWGKTGPVRFVDEYHVQRCAVADQSRLFAGGWYPGEEYDPTNVSFSHDPAELVSFDMTASSEFEILGEDAAPPALFKFATSPPISAERLLILRNEMPESFAVKTLADSGRSDLRDQFVVFQLNKAQEGPTIIEASEVVPDLVGSDDLPDVNVGLQLLSFNIGQNEDIDVNTKATMRLTMGKDPASADRVFENVNWAIAAGLELYDKTRKYTAAGKDLQADFNKAFPNRPIEIAGGLARFSFEVVKHHEPPWWRKVFSTLAGNSGQRLISVLGFPSITTDAIKLLDELVGRLDKSEPEVLFGSRPMTLALTARARDDFAAETRRMKVGSMARGYCILARGRDFNTIADADAAYYPHFERLVPKGVTEDQLLTGDFDDPLET